MKSSPARRTASIIRVGERFVDTVGWIACCALLLLASSIVIGILFRWIGIDNSWTYDLDNFSLVWVGFSGAVLASRLNIHVTSGVAIENMLRGHSKAIALLRFIVILGLLILFALSGWQNALNSFQTHETTLDIASWPVWVAKAALPVGCIFWALAEVLKFLKLFFAAEDS